MKNSLLFSSLVLSFGAFSQQVRTTPVTNQRSEPQSVQTEKIQIGTEQGNYQRAKSDVKSLNERMKEAEIKREIQSETVQPKKN